MIIDTEDTGGSVGKVDVYDLFCEYVPARMSERDIYDVTSAFLALFLQDIYP